MAKVAIKSEKLTPFGGIFSIMEQFDSMISPIIDHGSQGQGVTGTGTLVHSFGSINLSPMILNFAHEGCFL